MGATPYDRWSTLGGYGEHVDRPPTSVRPWTAPAAGTTCVNVIDRSHGLQQWHDEPNDVQVTRQTRQEESAAKPGFGDKA